jgi:two-component system response regulator CpxR
MRRFSMHRLLLADDDRELCEMLTSYLATEGFELSSVYDGGEAVAESVSGSYQLVILDVMLPKLSGFDALKLIRRQTQVPVLMLTARGEDVDSVIGLELGADDYLAKPCNPRVLSARIRAILRRSQAQKLPTARWSRSSSATSSCGRPRAPCSATAGS